MSEQSFRPGDRVKWDHSQGTTTGKVVKKVVSPIRIKDHKVAASRDDPAFPVECHKTGAQAALRPAAPRNL